MMVWRKLHVSRVKQQGPMDVTASGTVLPPVRVPGNGGVGETQTPAPTGSRTKLITAERRIKSMVSVRNLTSLVKAARDDGDDGTTKYLEDTPCNLELRSWHGTKDFKQEIVTPDKVDKFMTQLVSTMEDEVTLAGHLDDGADGGGDEDALSDAWLSTGCVRWLHMPGMNGAVLKSLQQHLHLADDVVDKSRTIVPNGSIEVEWYTANNLPMFAGENFEQLFIVSHYIQQSEKSDSQDEHTDRGFEFRQVTFVYFPVFNLIFSIDGTGQKSWERVKALCDNRRTPLRTSNEAAMVMSAMVDEMVDEVYTLLAFYGDSLEALEFLIISTQVADDHVLLSFKLKRRVQSLRRYAWDMRQLLQELRQNQYGVMPKQAANLCMTVESNCDSMVHIVEAYMLQCEGVESFYERHQEKVVASTLYMLTIVTVIILPVQLMTGIFGMNFQGKNPDDPLHSEGGMDQLYWEYGYESFWVLATICTLLIICCLKKRGMLDAKNITNSWHQKVEIGDDGDSDQSRQTPPSAASSTNASRSQRYQQGSSAESGDGDSPPPPPPLSGTPAKKYPVGP